MHLKTTFCAASALAFVAATGAYADSHTTTVTICYRQQRRHDPNAGADGRFFVPESRHQP